jgi:hypothetical protein
MPAGNCATGAKVKTGQPPNKKAVRRLYDYMVVHWFTTEGLMVLVFGCMVAGGAFLILNGAPAGPVLFLLFSTGCAGFGMHRWMLRDR